MTNPIDLVQGTPEWRQARCGKATGSRIADALAKVKSGGWGASRKNYRAELVVERLTNQPINGWVSKEMQWGIDNEPDARRLYAFMTDSVVRQVGFVPHPRIIMSGCSPDGWVGEEGIVQFKCPNTAQHLSVIDTDQIDDCYIKQINWEMACCERKWCDFVSYDPRVLIPEMQLYIQRVPRDDELIAEMEREIPKFLAEVTEQVERLRIKCGLAEAA
jgi:hypothetical protein